MAFTGHADRRGGDRVSRLVTAARCLRCPWTAAGDWEAVDKASEKHAAPGHPTATETKWEAK